MFPGWPYLAASRKPETVVEDDDVSSRHSAPIRFRSACILLSGFVKPLLCESPPVAPLDQPWSLMATSVSHLS